MAISERLQNRISNLTQGMGEINPPSRRMSNEEVQTAKKNNPDPMAFAMGSADGSGFYTDNKTTQQKLFCFVLLCFVGCGNYLWEL